MTPANFRNFLRDRRANVAMMFGLMVVPLIFIVGMGIDYGTAARLKSKMNAAADAAVLAAVTPAMMSQSDAASTTAATNMFNALVTGLPRLIYNSSTGLTVTVQDVGLQRTVTVAYNAQSQNLFGGVLNMNTIAFGGTSTGAAATPPNINFYLMLDDSPSMAIAGTPADITTMVNNTSAQSGCAFACHEANPAGENPALGNPHGEDNYALARSLGVTLRADLLDSAITDLTNQAYSAENNPSIPVDPVYQMSINSFDTAFHQLVPLTGNFVSAWSTQLSAMQTNNTQFLEVYDNNNACVSTSTTSHGVTTTNPCGSYTSNIAQGGSDADTNYDAAMQGITALMPTPGNGTNKTGDTPQEILFIVTDGVEDEDVSGSRQESTMTGTKDYCTPLKSKGIKIAILYTEYFPLPSNQWYNQHIASFQPSIGTTLQNCASSGLYYEVGLGQDISAALSELFQLAVASAHLTQ
ncbi:MAG: TadE/TadG family type IV pilus assembly protein [Roseiarcus sp.]